MSIVEVIEKIRSLAPLFVDGLGALVGVCTSVQLFLTIVGRFWSGFSTAAHWIGIAAVDLHKASDGVQRLAAFLGTQGKKSLGSIVLLVAIVVGCTIQPPAPSPTPPSPPVQVVDAGSSCDDIASEQAGALWQIAQAQHLTQGKAVDLCVAACQPFAADGHDVAVLHCLEGARIGASLAEGGTK